jgi:hypothetical protein
VTIDRVRLTLQTAQNRVRMTSLRKWLAQVDHRAGFVARIPDQGPFPESRHSAGQR